MSTGQIFSLMFYPYNKSILSKNSIAHRTFSGHAPFRRKLALDTCFSPVFEEKKIVSLSVQHGAYVNRSPDKQLRRCCKAQSNMRNRVR